MYIILQCHENKGYQINPFFVAIDPARNLAMTSGITNTDEKHEHGY